MLDIQEIRERLASAAETVEASEGEPLTFGFLAEMHGTVLKEFGSILEELKDEEDSPELGMQIVTLLDLLRGACDATEIGISSVAVRHFDEEMQEFHEKVQEN